MRLVGELAGLGREDRRDPAVERGHELSNVHRTRRVSRTRGLPEWTLDEESGEKLGSGIDEWCGDSRDRWWTVVESEVVCDWR